MNPYERYVSNKTINGWQCTIILHIYDLKISYVDSYVVDVIIEPL